MTDARKVMQDAMSEKELMRAIVTTARINGWLVHHDRPVRVARPDGSVRHQTAFEGDPGFPDLVLARDGEVIVVELKASHGRYEKGQREWLAATGGKTVRPADLDRLLARLRMPRASSVLTSPRLRGNVAP